MQKVPQGWGWGFRAGRDLREGGTLGFIEACLVDEEGRGLGKGEEAQGRVRGLEREMGDPREAQEIWKQRADIAAKEGGMTIMAGLSLVPELLGSGSVIPHQLASGSAQEGWCGSSGWGFSTNLPGLPQPGAFPCCPHSLLGTLELPLWFGGL